jgi:hypothetical protein
MMEAEQNPRAKCEHTRTMIQRRRSVQVHPVFDGRVVWTQLLSKKRCAEIRFTAIHPSSLDGASLQGLYNALEITCRSDSRLYGQLEGVQFHSGRCFQGHIQMSPTDSDMEEEEDGLKFDKFVLPFTDFRLTAYGGNVKTHGSWTTRFIQSIGLTLWMARMATSFSIWQRIRAVNMHEGAVFEGPPTPPPKRVNLRSRIPFPPSRFLFVSLLCFYRYSVHLLFIILRY